MEYTQINKTTKFSKGINSNEYIMLHHTGGGSFESNMKYLSENKAQVSCHYVVGKDGEVGKIGNDENVMWHAGLGNKDYGKYMNEKAIGIEVVGSGNDFTRKQIMALMNLCIYLKDKYAVPDYKIIRHKDFTTRKTDIGDGFYEIMGYKSFDEWKQGLITSHKGLEVVIGAICDKSSYNACYLYKTDTICLQEGYYKKTKLEKEAILLHEYAHYIFIKLVPRPYQVLWKSIYEFDNKVIKRINNYFKTNITENAFVSKYAEKNFAEGFSENIEEEYKRVERGLFPYEGYVGIKIKICMYLFNKYKKA